MTLQDFAQFLYSHDIGIIACVLTATLAAWIFADRS